MRQKKQWFETWFNTHYYHILYQNRNDDEAQLFISNLLNYLQPSQKAKILDLACGKGRHARFIAERGFDVTGIDLAPESIAFAKKSEHEYLRFRVSDMREQFAENEFDYVFNFFTSFGYFENRNDNFKAMGSIATALRPKGFLVIDFMNARKVMNTLVRQEQKTLNNIDFHIKRYIDGGFIVKEIKVEDATNKKVAHFEERVQALTLVYFKKFFQRHNLKLLKKWGDYELNKFDVRYSNRLIMLAQKEE